MKYLHTMVRVTDLEQSLHFYRDLLGLKEIRRIENEKGRYTLVFLAAPGQEETPVELTYNWDPEVYTGGRNFGHLAYEVDDIYAFCDKLRERRRHHQPPAARRPHGVRPLARQHLASKFCRKAPPSRRPNPGLPCRIPAPGRARSTACEARPAPL